MKNPFPFNTDCFKNYKQLKQAIDRKYQENKTAYEIARQIKNLKISDWNGNPVLRKFLSFLESKINPADPNKYPRIQTKTITEEDGCELLVTVVPDKTSNGVSMAFSSDDITDGGRYLNTAYWNRELDKKIKAFQKNYERLRTLNVEILVDQYELLLLRYQEVEREIEKFSNYLPDCLKELN